MWLEREGIFRTFGPCDGFPDRIPILMDHPDP